MKTLIVVPARYSSKRLPGKPLASLAGRSVLERTAARARAAAGVLDDAEAVVATDDERIAAHATERGFRVVMTDPASPSGSDRSLAAVDVLGCDPEFVVNLQGDAPFTPVAYLAAIVNALEAGTADVATPCVRLSWADLDELREAKKSTPFSGTTCIAGPDGRARWFSKAIIPAIRDEAGRRKSDEHSPVRRHVGLYAFRTPALRAFVATEPSAYEKTEGLEQLRILENGGTIDVVDVAATPYAIGGIDTPEDLARAVGLVDRFGDPDTEFFD